MLRSKGPSRGTILDEKYLQTENAGFKLNNTLVKQLQMWLFSVHYINTFLTKKIHLLKGKTWKSLKNLTEEKNATILRV